MSVSQLFYKGLSGVLMVLLTLALGSNTTAQCTMCPDEQVELLYSADNLSPAQGDEVCYTVRTRNFQSVVTFLFSINFSSSSLRLVDANTVISGLPSFTASSVFNPTPATGLDIIRVLWSAPGLTGECKDDGEVLMEICFEVIGNPGDPILFDINNNGFNGSSVEFISEDSTGMTCPTSSLTPIDGPLDSMSVPKSVTPNCMGVPQLYRRSICGTQAGFMDGVAELNVLCGTTPYTVNVSNGETFNTQDSIILIDSLLEGTYTVTVTDASGAISDPFEIIIDQSTPLEVTARLRPPRCPTDNRGSIILSVTGGQPYGSGEYRYNWNDQLFGIGANDNVSLSNGTYPVSIQDSIGCTVREEFVFDTEDPEPFISGIRDAFCERRNNGQIVVEGRGGSAFDGVGYNFTLTGITDAGEMVDNFSTQTLGGWPFGSLAAGNYVIGVEDSLQSRGGARCPMIFTDTIRVNYSREYTLSVTGGDVSGCGTGDGRASINIASTNPPANFNFTIEDAAGMAVQAGTSSSTAILSDCLPAGMYTIVVDDGQGCSTDTTFNLVACTLDILPIEEPPLCDNDTGIITLNASSDSLPIRYMWSNGDTTDTVTDLAPGDYEVTITDGANCSLIESFIVDPAEAILLSFDAMDPMCPSDSGSLTVIVDGGFDPYTFEWSPNPSGTDGDMLSNIPGGTYFVTVTDDDGCQAIDSFTLSSSSPPSAVVSNITTPRCEGDQSGAAVVSVVGNTDYPGPFEFLASTGVQGNNNNFPVTNFPSGRNWVVYNDITTGCVFDTVFIDIPQAAPLSLDDDLTTIGTVDCFGAQGLDGATVNLVAVQSGVDFTWPDGDVTNVKLQLSAGTYIVTLTAGLCVSTDTVIVTQPDSLEIFVDDMQSIFPSCGGDDATVVLGTRGGTPDYSYVWENAAGNTVSTDTFATNLAIGDYNVSVTDANGCQAVLPFSVDVATPVVAVLDPIVQPACFGEMGIISINSASGGAGGYRYQVNTAPAQDISLPFTTQPGDYTVRVFDAEGCSFDTLVTIIRPEELLVSAGPDQEIELGGSVTLTANITTSIAIDSVIWTAGAESQCLCS